jgi:hypothetical protein
MGRRPQLKLAVVIGATVVILCFLLFFDPAKSDFYPPCPFYTVTGFYCPGCGSLRAIHQLCCGNLVAAFGLNPLMVLSLPFLVYTFISYVTVLRGKPMLPVAHIPAFGIWVILLIIVMFCVLRNIPLYPFTLLAP